MKTKELNKDGRITFLRMDEKVLKKIPMFEHAVQCGFPSPADDFLDLDINLNDYLVKHKSATFCVRVNGSSMEGVGIHSGDILIVDRAQEKKNNCIVLAVIDNEFTVKRIKKSGEKLFLNPANENYQPIEITEDMNFQIWGVVTFVIHEL
jgi:DNA polymerase V